MRVRSGKDSFQENKLFSVARKACGRDLWCRSLASCIKALQHLKNTASAMHSHPDALYIHDKDLFAFLDHRHRALDRAKKVQAREPVPAPLGPQAHILRSIDRFQQGKHRQEWPRHRSSHVCKSLLHHTVHRALRRSKDHLSSKTKLKGKLGLILVVLRKEDSTFIHILSQEF